MLYLYITYITADVQHQAVQLLRELGAPEQPLPTRAVCDAYDGVRKDAVSLLSVHNAIQKKEKELAALRALNPSAGGGSKCTYSLTH